MLLVQQAAAEERHLLAPNSSWVLEYDDDSCALQRGFEADEQTVFLEIRQFEPGPAFQLTLASADFEVRRALPEIRYGDDADVWEAENASIANFGDDLRGVVLNDSMFPASLKEELQELDPNERQLRHHDLYRNLLTIRERENSIQSIGIAGSFRNEVTLQTGEMREPMDAMRLCMDELLTHWGIDAEAHQSLSRPALPRDYDRAAQRVIQIYPTSMLRQGNNARLRVRLAISEEGEVTGCHLQVPIEHDEFREAACRSLGRARFEPALDQDNNPIASFWTTTISYYVN